MSGATIRSPAGVGPGDCRRGGARRLPAGDAAGIPAIAGFTLIETMVVMIIAVGLVMIMGLLLRSTAQTAISLRAGAPEWTVQRTMRDQLWQTVMPAREALVPGASTALPATISGSANELFVVTWNGRRDGLTGKPVMALYSFDTEARRLDYRELPLPPWWGSGPAGGGNGERLRADLRLLPPVALINGVDDLSFRYAPAEGNAARPESWPDRWSADEPPRIVLVDYERAGRRYSLWLETHGWPG